MSVYPHDLSLLILGLLIPADGVIFEDGFPAPCPSDPLYLLWTTLDPVVRLVEPLRFSICSKYRSQVHRSRHGSDVVKVVFLVVGGCKFEAKRRLSEDLSEGFLSRKDPKSVNIALL